ncbi:hypothetical protein HAX54_014527 [Datura stramonium]|uniref:Uncharacterized protein n=1 Tax=Datura stramonium TaxID=4076 RepID=A0ABS8TQ11_DATST|nr:hypothetical protein [Datura stramonium]
MDDKLVFFVLKRFALIMGISCRTLPREDKLAKLYVKGVAFCKMRFVEDDPFKNQVGASKIVHPYIISVVCEMEEEFMKIFVLYLDEVHDQLIDALKIEFEGLTIIFSSRRVPRRLGKEPCCEEDTESQDIGSNADNKLLKVNDIFVIVRN